MKAVELIQQLDTNKMMIIIQSLGGIIYNETENEIILNTICHGGQSPNKLYYYKDSKRFFCYSECGALSIFDIINNIKDYDTKCQDAMNYICTLLGISDIKYGFQDESIEVIDDWSFITNIKNKRTKYEDENKLKKIDKRILNMFQPIYCSQWIDENITIEVMKAFQISYCTSQQQIIIPHFNHNNDLIGIRGRNMINANVLEFGKYVPFYDGINMYNHKLSHNLYGININKETIKKKKKVMLVESEKSVLQCATMFGIQDNFTLALCGSSSIHFKQIKLLLDLGVTEVILALDRQYVELNDEECKAWSKKIKNKFINELLPYFNVYVLWDTENLLDYKDSPTDKGAEVLLKLMKNKIYIKQ